MKNWNEFAEGPEFDLLLTVCDSAAAETCLTRPGRPISVYWGTTDPTAVEGSDSAKAAREKLQAIGREADKR